MPKQTTPRTTTPRTTTPRTTTPRTTRFPKAAPRPEPFDEDEGNASGESGAFELEERAEEAPLMAPFSDDPINPFRVTPDLRFENTGFQLLEKLGDEDAVHFAACDIMLPLGMPFKLLLVSGHDSEGSPHLRLMLHRPSAEAIAGLLDGGRITEILNPLCSGNEVP